MDHVWRLASESGLVIFSKSSCCMCHAMMSFFNGFGANATVHELNNGPIEKEMERALITLLGGRNPPVPAVFIGGRLVGTTHHVNTLHLEGKLVPMLLNAGVISVWRTE